MPTTPSTSASARRRPARLVEGEGEGVGAGAPGVALGLGRPRAASAALDRRASACGGAASASSTAVDQRLLGGLGLGQLGAQARRLSAVEPLGSLVQRASRASTRPSSLGRAALDARRAAAELAPHLGGARRTARGDAVGPLAPRTPAALGGQRGLGLGRARRPRAPSSRASASTSASSLGDAGRLGLERGDHGLVDGDRRGRARRRGAARPAARPGPRARSRSDSKRTSASPRSSPPMAASSASAASTSASSSASCAAARARLRGERRARPRAPCSSRAAQRGDLAAGEVEPQRRQLGDQVAVAAGGVGLALERAQLAPHLAQQVLQAQQVALGGVEAALGLLLARAGT